MVTRLFNRLHKAVNIYFTCINPSPAALSSSASHYLTSSSPVHCYRHLNPLDSSWGWHFFSLSLSAQTILTASWVHIVLWEQEVKPLLEWGMQENKHSLALFNNNQAARSPVSLERSIGTKKWASCFADWQVFMIRGSLYTPVHALKSDRSLWCWVSHEVHTLTKTHWRSFLIVTLNE